MGGTLRYVAARPDLEEFSGKIQLASSDVKGGEESYKANVAVNLPVIEDVFGLRIVAGTDQVGGYAETFDGSEKDVNGKTTDNVRIKALWHAADNIEVTGLYWHMETGQDYSNLLQQVDPTKLPDTGGTKGFAGGDNDVYSLGVTWSLENFDVVSTTSYLDIDVPLLIPYNQAPAGRILVDARFQAETWAQEVRLVSTDSGPMNWIVGGYYSTTDAVQYQDQRFVDNDIFQAIVGGDAVQEIDTEVMAVFGEISYELMDGKLVPLFGIRYFEDERKLTDNTLRSKGIDLDSDPAQLALFDAVFGGVGLITGCADLQALSAGAMQCETQNPEFKNEDTFRSTNPRFNLSYFPTEQSMLYFNAAKGFRSGYLQTLAGVQAAAIDGVTTSQSLDSDEVYSYEIGGKWTLLDNRAQVEFAFYRADYKDAQVLFTTSSTTPAAVIGGDYRADGFEFTGTLLLTDNLKATLNYSAVDTEWTKVVDDVAAVVEGVEKGEAVPYIPDTDWGLSLEYTGSIPGTDLTHFEKIRYHYKDTQFNYSGLRSADLEDISLRVGITGNQWQASLYANNIADEQGPALRTSSGVIRVYPREIGLNLQFDF